MLDHAEMIELGEAEGDSDIVAESEAALNPARASRAHGGRNIALRRGGQQ